MPDERGELDRLAGETQAVYERNAARFDSERHKILIERGWLDRFLALIPPARRVLDLGCGAGEPIAAYLLEKGCVLTGVDFAEPMLEIARKRFPEARFVHQDMRALDLTVSFDGPGPFDGPSLFDGIVGWHSFFHLTQAEQAATLPRLAAHLAPGGVLMLTVGHEAGERIGRVGDDTVYHASLSKTEFERILTANGMSLADFVAEDPACDGATILLATNRRD
ncbi:MAG: class I SAM-dependent methyltransferase [Alphaproteobacteria bacterium]|nr:class I SAM-dependent methyltransferase [Alphaproteobacteria bacterium]